MLRLLENGRDRSFIIHHYEGLLVVLPLSDSVHSPHLLLPEGHIIQRRLLLGLAGLRMSKLTRYADDALEKFSIESSAFGFTKLAFQCFI